MVIRANPAAATGDMPQPYRFLPKYVETARVVTRDNPLYFSRISMILATDPLYVTSPFRKLLLHTPAMNFDNRKLP